MEKFYRDGQVGVVYSPEFGAGWSTWGGHDQRESLCMDHRIVQAVLDGDTDRAAAIAEEMFPDFYTGGADDLVVGWVPKGEAFEIDEYDGSEIIIIISQRKYMVA